MAGGKKGARRSGRHGGPEYRTTVAVVLLALGGLVRLAAAADGRLRDNPFLDLSLEELANVPVTIATGTAKPLHEAPALASVITAADIKAMGWRTLHEALESVPGVHVSLQTNRLNHLISIRGIHTDYNPQVAVMLDGQPLVDMAYGHPGPRFAMPVENIARIEVIRGPGSAVYGADAYAGIINVITKKVEDLKGTAAGVRTGSFGSRDIWAQGGTEVGNWDTAISLEYSHSNGDAQRTVDSDLQTILDNAFGTSASLAPGMLETRYRILNTTLAARNDPWNVQFYSWSLRGGGQGPGGTQALDPVGTQEMDRYGVALGYDDKQAAPHWELASRLSYFLMDQDVTFRLLPPGATVPIGADGNLFTPNTLCAPASVCLVSFPDGVWGNPGARQREQHFDLATVYSGFLDHRLRFAVGAFHYEYRSLENKNFGPGVIDGTVPSIDGTLTDVTGTDFVFMPNVSRTVQYLSAQDEWQIAPAWELTAGVRYDRYSDFGDTTNPRLALVWNATPRLTAKLLYGRAFRAPSFGELYLQNNPVAEGNRDLRPETLDTLELAADYHPSPRLQASLGLFHYQAKDLIEYVDSKAQNTGEQSGKGLEAEVAWQPDRHWRIKGNGALQYAENEKTGEPVPNAPRRQAYLAAIWEPSPRWSASAQAKWIGDRPRNRAAGDTRPAIADYTLVNLTARYRPSPPWELSLLVHNLFDQDAREPSNINNGTVAIPEDYPLEGRAVFIEARYQLW